MNYEWEAKPKTSVSAAGKKLIDDIKESEYAVLVGRNNCGKSFLLKTMTQEIGKNASYLGPARYHNFTMLNFFTPRRNKQDEKWRQFIDQFRDQHQNIDNSPLNLQEAIAELNDERREQLKQIVMLLLGSDLDFLFTVPDNSMSQKYVSCNGHNISFSSSGVRLISTLVTCLLDPNYDTFLIDEPELGISPEAQGMLADFLFDKQHREKYFPHIKTLILGTHSTLFLDRRRITNNYSVEKQGDEIDIRRTDTITEFNDIHFFLLGNRLETLYLPACIIICEGPCDHTFISKVVHTRYAKVQFSIINGNGDSRIKEIVSVTGSILTDLQKSPYRNRIVIVLDQRHGKDIVETLSKAGIPKDNIIIWEENGIEYYYPESILAEIFGAGGAINIEADSVSRNGATYKKRELCDRVTAKITRVTEYSTEFSEKFLKSIETICDIKQ